MLAKAGRFASGEVVIWTRWGWHHTHSVSHLTTCLVRGAIRHQRANPITLIRHGEPQPDLVIHNEPRR